MICLVPLDTSLTDPPGSNLVISSYTLTQALAAGVSTVTFDLTSFGFVNPPSNIVPSIVRSTGGSSGITAFPRQWTATSFTCDLSTPTSDGTFVCSIQIFP